MTVEQIQTLLEQARNELRDIRNIPKDLPMGEKAGQVEARLLAGEMLETILMLAKNQVQRSTKDKFFYLPKK